VGRYEPKQIYKNAALIALAVTALASPFAFAATVPEKDICRSNAGNNAEIIGVIGNQCFKAFRTTNGKTYATLGNHLDMSSQDVDRLNTLYPTLQKCFKRCSSGQAKKSTPSNTNKTTAKTQQTKPPSQQAGNTGTNSASKEQQQAKATPANTTTQNTAPKSGSTTQNQATGGGNNAVLASSGSNAAPLSNSASGQPLPEKESHTTLIENRDGTYTEETKTITRSGHNSHTEVGSKHLEAKVTFANGESKHLTREEADLAAQQAAKEGKPISLEVDGVRYSYDEKGFERTDKHETYEGFINRNASKAADEAYDKKYSEAGTKEEKKAKKASSRQSADNCWESLEAAKAAGLTGKELDRFRCDPTTQFAKGVEVGNQVLQTAGATAINMIGTTTAAKHMDGTRSSLEKGAAKAAKTARIYETNLAAANTAAAVVLGIKANQHKKNAGTLVDIQRAARANTSESQGRTAADALFNKQQNTNSVEQLHGERLQKAINEQQNARNVANAATFLAAMNAMKSGTNAAVAESTRKKAESVAKEYEKLEAAARANNIAWSGELPVGTLPGQEGTFASTGEESQLSTDGTNGDTDTSLLPNGNDLGGGMLDGPQGPVAGAFKAGGAAGGGGSGGGGAAGLGGGGGGGMGGDPGAEDAKASYASEFGTKERYESGGGGGGYAARAGGGKGGAGKEDGGLDLNGLLAQFLPKQEEEMQNRNGILDFASGGRMPAALPNEAASYLDKNADLFQRIHETMSEKNRKGQIGG
jgi:hypothetical protein